MVAALRNPALRAGLGGYGLSSIGEWALWVAILVAAYQSGGAHTAGLTSLGLLLPSVVTAVLAGPAADGRRPERVVLLAHLTQLVGGGGAAALLVLDAPFATVVASTAVFVAATALIRPCYAVLMPSSVRTVGELTAANLLTGWIDNTAVLAGPLLAAGTIAARGPDLTLAAVAGLAAFSAASAVPAMRRRRRAAIGPVAATPRVNPLRAMRACFRGLGERRGVRPVLGLLAVQQFVVGALDLVYVVVAVELLGMAASGTGLLSAAFGAGGILGGLALAAVVGTRRLAPLLSLGVAISALALILVGALPAHTVLAVGCLAAAGIGRAVVELTARMLLQRSAPADALASVFALVEVTGAVGMVLGSLMVQILIATSGGRAALIGVAATLTVVLALSYRAVRHADRSATVPVVAIRLLRELPAFTHLQAPALEGVARAATEMPVTAGTEVIREGDTGDRFYAVVDGRVRVEMGGRFKRHIQRGDGFGEIALLADVPRIATVTAETDTLLLAIEREPFLLAVTGNDAATVASWGAVDRMDTEGVLDHLHRDP